MSHMNLWFKGLTPELYKYAEETLGETSEIRQKALDDFKLLIRGRQDIYSRKDDAFLLRFLRAHKFDVSKSFRIFCNCHDIMTKYRGVYFGKTPSEMRHVFEMNFISYAPYRMPPCSAVGIYRLGNFDVRKASAVDFAATQIMVAELLLESEATQLCGGVFVVDAKGATLQHYTQFLRPSLLSLWISMVQDAWPMRVDGIHFVHEFASLHAVFMVVKYLIKKKLRDRIHFHGNDLNSLHQHIPKNFLPEELGGTLGPFDSSDFKSYVYSQEAHFNKNKEYGIVQKNSNKVE